MGLGQNMLYEISVDFPLRDPIRGSGSPPAEDLKWMSSLVGSAELRGCVCRDQYQTVTGESA